MTKKDNFNQQATEDYIKAIYKLAEVERPVSTMRIAGELGVRPASVTSMVKKLDRLGLVDYTKHYGVELTAAGETMAMKTIRRHRLIELYLAEALGYGWDEVHEEAELLEHAVSSKLAGRIADVLGQPVFDPHGEPIPTQKGTIREMMTQPLTALPPGARARISCIGDDSDRELLKYLAQLGLKPGQEITIIDTAPFNGPITVEINNQQQIVGYRAAGLVLVETNEIIDAPLASL